ncbi:MAG: oligoribonuclease [Deltaproteobacteria bacterium]|nr:oligoribonuclease [Deltaproteobacteria bacterium]
MDMEMTGLDPDTDSIIEIATLITDSELNVIAEGPELAIHQPADRFARMDAWNQEHHTKSGLWAKVQASTVTIAQAEVATLDFIRKHCGERESPLCGNSIWQDRRFLVRYMPKLDAYLHYRILDVSTIKELASRWYPGSKFKKPKGAHRALDDVKESLDELRYYRTHLFKPKVEG